MFLPKNPSSIIDGPAMIGFSFLLTSTLCLFLQLLKTFPFFVFAVLFI